LLRLLREHAEHADDGDLRPEHDRRRRPRRIRRRGQRRNLPDHRHLRRHLRDVQQGERGMTTATEAAGRSLTRPVSRSRRLRKSRFGRILFRAPFYLLILVIAVYTLFPFYWVVRSSFTPEVNLFQTPIQYIPQHPTLDNYREVLSANFFTTAL